MLSRQAGPRSELGLIPRRCGNTNPSWHHNSLARSEMNRRYDGGPDVHSRSSGGFIRWERNVPKRLIV